MINASIMNGLGPVTFIFFLAAAIGIPTLVVYDEVTRDGGPEERWHTRKQSECLRKWQGGYEARYDRPENLKQLGYCKVLVNGRWLPEQMLLPE